MADLIIPVVVPEEYINEARIHVLLAAPKPVSFEGTDLEWITSLLEDQLRGLYRRGKEVAANTDIEYQEIIRTEE